MTSPQDDVPTSPGADTGPGQMAPPDSRPYPPNDTPSPSGGPPSPPSPTPWGPEPGFGGASPEYGAGLGYGPPPGYGMPPGGGPVPVYGAPGPGYGPSTWSPPAPQPGIVPLRPLGLGEILDGSFRAIRSNPRVMFGLTAAVVTVVVAISAVINWYVGGLIGGALTDLASTTDPEGVVGIDELGPSLAGVVSAPLLALATTVLTGLLIISVSRSVIGGTISLPEVVHAARASVWWVVGFSLLLGLAWALAFGLFAGAVALLAVNEIWWAMIVVLMVGGPGLTVVAVWVTVRTLLVPAALMLEGGRFWATIARAWRLTRGSFWRLFGIYLVVQVIVGVVVSSIVYAFTLIGGLVLQDPLLTSFPGIVVSSIANIIASTISTVFTAAVVALLYVDVRMRREGLDVELARAADEQSAWA